MKALKWLLVGLFVVTLAWGGSTVAYAQDEPAINPDENQAGQALAGPGVYLPLVGSGPNALEARALALVAERNNLASDALVVASVAQAQYPLQGKSAYALKLVDQQSGATYQVMLDADGAELDAAALDSAEQAAYASRYGNLEPALAELMAASSADAIPVILWLKEPATEPMARPDANDEMALASVEQQDAYFAQVDAQRAAAVASVQAPLANRLAAMGIEATAAKYEPVLYAALAPTALQEVSRWSEVTMVYLDRINQTELEIARATVNGNIVNSRGITGAGVRVAQIEVGGRVATVNPNLAGVVQSTTYVCAAASSHSTGVAGIIRSTNATRRGIASGATLWAGGSCAGNNSQLQNRSTAAADWGARSLNLSWGSNIGLVPGANDRFYDSMVINRFRSIIKSSGNEAGTCNSRNGNVTSPGLAYNVITVGNFDDRNTIGWTGDTMNSCSSWRDPSSLHNDREKPEVSAPGSNINSTTTASPWTGAIGSGTSYAAPVVTGATALLLQRNSGLTSWPEAVKAILMATAVHNIEGATRLSEFDGAGGVVLDRADDVARRVTGNWGAQSYSCSTATPLNVTTMALTAGVRTRVAIAWDNDPNYTNYATRPSADLDLHVRNPSGSLVAVSVSWDNTYEIVDFTPTVSGNYTLRIARIRCDLSPRWLGWAWRRGN